MIQDNTLGRGIALAACMLAGAWIVVAAPGHRAWVAAFPFVAALSFAGMLVPKTLKKKKTGDDQV